MLTGRRRSSILPYGGGGRGSRVFSTDTFVCGRSSSGMSGSDAVQLHEHHPQLGEIQLESVEGTGTDSKDHSATTSMIQMSPRSSAQRK